MPSRIVRQPNGLFAQFSTVVDDFTHYGMTEAEAYEVCLEGHAPEVAKNKMRRGVEDDMNGLSPKAGRAPDGLNRWRDALYTIALIHGAEVRDAVVEEILGAT